MNVYATGSMAPDTPNKIFMGGIPLTLSDEQVRELVSPFGELKSFALVKDPATNNSRVCLFVIILLLLSSTLQIVLVVDDDYG